MRNIYSIYKEHYKALISLGLPIVIGQIGVIVLGFADTLMIGHHSTIELGAASFVNNVFNLVIIFSTGFSYGLTPIVGGLYGTHQYASAGHTDEFRRCVTACWQICWWHSCLPSV